MTKEQERILQHEVDAGWAKGIPESAKWHMQHRPYRDNAGGDTDGDEQVNDEGTLRDIQELQSRDCRT